MLLLAVLAFLETALVTLLQLIVLARNQSYASIMNRLTPPSILQSVKQLLDREESAAPLSASMGEASARPMTVVSAKIEKRILKGLAGGSWASGGN